MMKLKNLFKTPGKKLEESILEFSSSIDAIFKRYEHLYVFWDNRDFKYATENYTYWHRAVAWNSKVYTPWEVVPRTFDNDLPLHLCVLHHGLHPEDWIVKNEPNTKSMPPIRLISDILLELNTHLLSESLKKIRTNLETYSEQTVEEKINSRFDILDL